MIAVDQARRDDADHARVPVLVGEHVERVGRAARAARALLGEQALGLEQDRGLDRLALGVDRVELARDLERAVLVRA